MRNWESGYPWTENEWREHMSILGSAGNVLFLDVDNGCKSLFILRKLL